MDYKETIEQLRELLPSKVDYAELIGAEPVHYGHEFVYEDPESYIIENAINAIKTLLIERDVAVDEMHGRCIKCKHYSTGFLNFPCTDCCYESGNNDHWEWRGVTKENNYERI